MALTYLRRRNAQLAIVVQILIKAHFQPTHLSHAQLSEVLNHTRGVDIEDVISGTVGQNQVVGIATARFHPKVSPTRQLAELLAIKHQGTAFIADKVTSFTVQQGDAAQILPSLSRRIAILAITIQILIKMGLQAPHLCQAQERGIDKNTGLIEIKSVIVTTVGQNQIIGMNTAHFHAQVSPAGQLAQLRSLEHDGAACVANEIAQ